MAKKPVKKTQKQKQNPKSKKRQSVIQQSQTQQRQSPSQQSQTQGISITIDNSRKTVPRKSNAPQRQPQQQRGPAVIPIPYPIYSPATYKPSSAPAVAAPGAQQQPNNPQPTAPIPAPAKPTTAPATAPQVSAPVFNRPRTTMSQFTRIPFPESSSLASFNASPSVESQLITSSQFNTPFKDLDIENKPIENMVRKQIEYFNDNEPTSKPPSIMKPPKGGNNDRKQTIIPPYEENENMLSPLSKASGYTVPIIDNENIIDVGSSMDTTPAVTPMPIQGQKDLMSAIKTNDAVLFGSPSFDFSGNSFSSVKLNLDDSKALFQRPTPFNDYPPPPPKTSALSQAPTDALPLSPADEFEQELEKADDKAVEKAVEDTADDNKKDKKKQIPYEKTNLYNERMKRKELLESIGMKKDELVKTKEELDKNPDDSTLVRKANNLSKDVAPVEVQARNINFDNYSKHLKTLEDFRLKGKALPNDESTKQLKQELNQIIIASGKGKTLGRVFDPNKILDYLKVAETDKYVKETKTKIERLQQTKPPAQQQVQPKERTKIITTLDDIKLNNGGIRLPPIEKAGLDGTKHYNL
jgi:hypothetical protein